MITALFTWHTYIIVNAAIAVSYPLTRGIMKITYIKTRLSQRQQLLFARFCFLLTIVAFFIMPLLAGLLSIDHSNLEFKPVIHHASMSFLRHHENVAADIASVQTLSYTLPINKIVFLVWLTGFLFFSLHLAKKIYRLRIINAQAFCRHRLKNVSILFSSMVTVPFCWSLLNRHFVVLHQALLEKPEELRIAIRHESQHLRAGDTYWLQAMIAIKLICYCNPIIKLWINWFSELQEFACDEAIILRKKVSPTHYAQCLINTARFTTQNSGLTLSINGLSKSILYRRVNMLFSYKNKKRKFTLIAAYALSFCAITSAAYALNGSTYSAPLTSREVASLIRESDSSNDFRVIANREVVEKINEIRSNKKIKKYMLLSLDRMRTYQPYIQEELKKYAMPDDILAIPLVESGYRPLPENVNPMHAAGIWQIIPSTAQKFGLSISKEKDERLDTEHSTKAALTYLSVLYKQFQDWRLSALAYEIGENEVERLIQLTGSRDAWTIMRSSHTPKKYKKEVLNYLAMLDASIIIMHNPALITH